MIGRALALGAALVPLLALALPARAQDDYEDYEEEITYAKEGAYATALGSYAYYDDRNDNSGGGGAIIGVHVIPQFAMEGQWEMHENSNTQLATYNFKVVPFTEIPVQPWLKAGFGLLGSRPNHPFLFLGRFQAGADWMLTNTLALTGGAGVGVAAHDNDIYTVSLGISYYFE